MKILHIIPDLYLGGAGRSLLSAATYLSKHGEEQHVVSLGPVHPSARKALSDIGISHQSELDFEEIGRRIDLTDCVLVHYWHTARMERLLRHPWPSVRRVAWVKVQGGTAPQLLRSSVCDVFDLVIATASSSLSLPGLRSSSTSSIYIPSVMEPSRLLDVDRVPEGKLRVGYLGYVDFIKLHSDFVEMSCEIPRDVIVPVWGAGNASALLKTQARQFGRSEMFQWMGQTSDIAAAFGAMDIFGYPLRAENYGTTDKALQEAMYSGLPSVVFDRPGQADLAIDGQTALVVRDKREYVAAIAALVDSLELRTSLGLAAQRHIKEHFDPKTALARIYSELRYVMGRPERERSQPTPLRQKEGVALFMETLNEFAEPFQASLSARTSSEMDRADDTIANLWPGFFDAASGGGVLDYRKEFPSDPWLAFWSGLLLFAAKSYGHAFAEFVLAERLGLPPARPRDWKARAHAELRRLGSTGDAISTALV